MSGTIAVEEHSTCVTHEGSSCSSNNKTTTITVRVPLWLLQRLKEKGVSNISNFARKLMLHEVEGELTKEEEIEYELQTLKEEMTKLHDYHKTLVVHGSYAKDYMEKLKDGNIVTHRPFYFSKPEHPVLNRDELKLVDETVKLREKLAEQYREQLKELLKLKRERYNLSSTTANIEGGMAGDGVGEKDTTQTLQDDIIIIEEKAIEQRKN